MGLNFQLLEICSSGQLKSQLKHQSKIYIRQHPRFMRKLFISRVISRGWKWNSILSNPLINSIPKDLAKEDVKILVKELMDRKTTESKF